LLRYRAYCVEERSDVTEMRERMFCTPAAWTWMLAPS
jgi:hypothetical protein